MLNTNGTMHLRYYMLHINVARRRPRPRSLCVTSLFICSIEGDHNNILIFPIFHEKLSICFSSFLCSAAEAHEENKTRLSEGQRHP